MPVNWKRTTALLKRMADRLLLEVRGCNLTGHEDGGEKANQLLGEWSVECAIEATLIELEIRESLSAEQVERDCRQKIHAAEAKSAKAHSDLAKTKARLSEMAEQVETLTCQRDYAVSEANRLQALLLARPEVDPLATALQMLMVAMYLIPFAQDQDDLYRRMYVGSQRMANDAMRAVGALRDVPIAQMVRQTLLDAYDREMADGGV